MLRALHGRWPYRRSHCRHDLHWLVCVRRTSGGARPGARIQWRDCRRVAGDPTALEGPSRGTYPDESVVGWEGSGGWRRGAPPASAPWSAIASISRGQTARGRS